MPGRGRRFLLVGLLLVGAGLMIAVGSWLPSSPAPLTEEEAAGAPSVPAAYTEGNFAESSRVLQETVSEQPENAQAQLLLGRSLEAEGRASEALDAYQRSLQLQPRQPEALYRVAVLRRAEGDLAGAVGALKRAVAADGKFAPARLLLAELYLAKNDTPAALEQYEAVVRLAPSGVDLGDIERRSAEMRKE